MLNQESLGRIGKYDIYPLEKTWAEINVDALTILLNQIPEVKYTYLETLAESKGLRIFYGKWDHSMVLMDGPKIIGLAFGYEREKENNDEYPENTLYISELVIDKKYRKKGLGKELLSFFMDYNKKIGYRFLIGGFNFTTQTNSAGWNSKVQSLYESLGFKKRTIKTYENRQDVVYYFKP